MVLEFDLRTAVLALQGCLFALFSGDYCLVFDIWIGMVFLSIFCQLDFEKILPEKRVGVGRRMRSDLIRPYFDIAR